MAVDLECLEGVLLYVEEGGSEYSLRWEFGVW